MSGRFVIIGHGPAGLSAAETLRARLPDAEIRIVSAEPFPFYSRPGLAYYLADDVPEKQLFSRPEDHYRSLRLELIHTRAEAIEPAAHTVRLSDGRQLPYDTLLLATGSKAVRPDVPGIDLDGVVTLDNLPDTRHILEVVHRARRGGSRAGGALVVGGGITALEMVEGFLGRGLKTHYLLRHNHFWSNVLTERESDLILHRLREMGTQVHAGSELLRINGSGGRVASVETSRGETIPCSIVGVAVGVRPQVELAREAGLRVDRGVLVDDGMHTNISGIYAAGDVAQIVDPTTGRATLDILWPVAVATGQVAGANMAGADQRYRKGAPFNVARLAELPITIMGQVGTGRADADTVATGRGASESWDRQQPLLNVEATDPPELQRWVLRGDRIVGAVLLGDQRLSEPLRTLIEHETDISPIREALLAPDGTLAAKLLAFAEQVRAHRP
jgi:NAD(P)H-nitrite reductase large subunit